MKNLNKKIIFDTDVLSHFAHASQLKTLFEFYNGSICIPFDVKDEIEQMNSLKHQRLSPALAKKGRELLSFIHKYNIEVIEIFTGTPEYSTYIELKEVYNLDKGEAACIAIAKYNDKIISSCNYRDINRFIKNKTIINIPALEILEAFYKSGIKTLEEIETIKELMVKKGADLPKGTMKELFNL